MTKYLTLAQENLRDLQIEEGKRRELFGPEEEGLEDSYENALGRLDSDAITVPNIAANIGRLPDFGWSEELEHLRRTTMEQRMKPYAKLVNRIKNPTFEDTAQAIYAELFDLLVARQAKYGSSNIEQQGLYGVLVRIRDDKISRIQRALNGRIDHGQVVLDNIDLSGEEGDTLEDAYKDLANYAVISLMLLRGEWGHPLATDA